MITESKLANQPDNKLTKKFKPIDTGGDDYGKPRKKSKKKSKTKLVILLPLLMIAIAGATFGIMWLINKKDRTPETTETSSDDEVAPEGDGSENTPQEEAMDEWTASIQPITAATSSNPTIQYGRLMLINPNFTVEPEFIKNRKMELISLTDTYGIKENKSSNGDNLIDKEAGEWLNKMLSDYTLANPGHVMETRSCFRMVGTGCGRMCAATGASDHHSGLTCDLIDPTYGTSLDTGEYDTHQEWKWLKENSYKYGFIDRFPEAWAGGPMSEPAVVNEDGSTGLFETWHYRYVGVYAATEIATGVYNNGNYDSLEHYLKARGLVPNLLNN